MVETRRLFGRGLATPLATVVEVAFLIQLAAVASIWVFSFGITWILGKVIDVTMGLRVSETEESVGLDISQHGEKAYGGE